MKFAEIKCLRPPQRNNIGQQAGALRRLITAVTAAFTHRCTTRAFYFRLEYSLSYRLFEYSTDTRSS